MADSPLTPDEMADSPLKEKRLDCLPTAIPASAQAVEYSTHVTSYLKEMQTPVTGPRAFVCLQSALCEGRYRGYVLSLVTALLLGSHAYDRSTQLDRSFLILGLYAVNIGCWILLALAEPDAPAASWVKSVAGGRSKGVQLARALLSRMATGRHAAGSAEQPILAVRPRARARRPVRGLGAGRGGKGEEGACEELRVRGATVKSSPAQV